MHIIENYVCSQFNTRYSIKTQQKLTEPPEVLFGLLKGTSDGITESSVSFSDDMVDNNNIDVCAASCQPRLNCRHLHQVHTQWHFGQSCRTNNKSNIRHPLQCSSLILVGRGWLAGWNIVAFSAQLGKPLKLMGAFIWWTGGFGLLVVWFLQFILCHYYHYHYYLLLLLLFIF